MEKVNIEELSFQPQDKGVKEYHTLIHITDKELTFNEQLELILNTFEKLQQNRTDHACPVFVRVFLSDAANQAALVTTRMAQYSCALSLVEQPPLDGSKIAFWIYWMTDVTIERSNDGLVEVTHEGHYKHLWLGCAVNPSDDSHLQTYHLLEDYTQKLKKRNLTLADNCMRTWFFVQNVDVNYAGVVKGRNEIFAQENLTPKTHFIASTGIGGRHADPKIKVIMDSYAIDGIRPEQIHYLYAPSHLNPTYEYGVSFERGTYIDYADRRHVFISGTASINNKGEIVHQGQVALQVERLWENVETLLKEADCTFDNVCHMLVYLRDIGDYNVVRKKFEQRFPQTPKIFLWAPVCRPGWLVEMECMATKPIVDQRFKSF